jgi:7-carboxy-7-deazaguanine synthase
VARNVFRRVPIYLLQNGLEENLSENLLLSEIFKSVQGEGVNLGTPTVFLRLAVCNLHCWYCDTKFTWLYSKETLELVKKEMERLVIPMDKIPNDIRVYSMLEEARAVPVGDVETEIRQFNLDHLVITGGEPMLQQKQLVSLLRRLKTWYKNYFVEVETNGTIKPDEDILQLVDQWNVSPKLESSGNSRFAREKKSTLESFASLRNSFFKFVVQDSEDLVEVESLARHSSISPGKIILMPEGTEASVLKERTVWLSEICESKGYRLTPRLHILLWGNKRGT